MKLPYTGYLYAPEGPLLLYYISDRRQFRGNPKEQSRQLLEKIAECAAAGVDYIQLREKDLGSRALEELAAAAVMQLPGACRTKLLINSRSDVALVSGAGGVHLPANDLAASEVRAIFGQMGNIHPVIAVSTHSSREIAYAESHGADFALFGPVFEKDGTIAHEGLKKLAEACRQPERAVPILAVGGVTPENVQQCIAAGANGIAAIRMFQDADVARTVNHLRAMQVK